MTSRQIKSKLYELFGIQTSVSTQIDYENDLTFVSVILSLPMPDILDSEIANTIANNELYTDITLIPHPQGIKVRLTINEWADLLSGFDRPRGITIRPQHLGFPPYTDEPIPPCSNCKVEKSPEVAFMIGADSKYYCEKCAEGVRRAWNRLSFLAAARSPGRPSSPPRMPTSATSRTISSMRSGA